MKYTTFVETLQHKSFAKRKITVLPCTNFPFIQKFFTKPNIFVKTRKIALSNNIKPVQQHQRSHLKGNNMYRTIARKKRIDGSKIHSEVICLQKLCYLHNSSSLSLNFKLLFNFLPRIVFFFYPILKSFPEMVRTMHIQNI